MASADPTQSPAPIQTLGPAALVFLHVPSAFAWRDRGGIVESAGLHIPSGRLWAQIASAQC
jgi:hypothetical protein